MSKLRLTFFPAFLGFSYSGFCYSYNEYHAFKELFRNYKFDMLMNKLKPASINSK